MKADELFNKYCHFDGVVPIVDKSDFMAALKEYGEHVKSEAVKVCNEIDSEHDYYGSRVELFCAAAIEKMELP